MRGKQKLGSAPEYSKAEEELVSAFDTRLRKKPVTFQSGGRQLFVEVDGYSKRPRILCEAWAHIGPPKPAQKNKIMKDVLKLIFLEKMLGKRYKKVLLFANDAARVPFIAGSWMAECLRAYDIHAEVIALSDKQRKEILKAQKRLYR